MRHNIFSDSLRRFIGSWLCALLIEYLLLPQKLRALDGFSALSGMSLMRVLILTLLFGSLLTFFSILKKQVPVLPERILLAACGILLLLFSLCASFSWPFFAVSLLITLGLIHYLLLGTAPERTTQRSASSCSKERHPRLWICILTLCSVSFFLFVGIWTVCRVYSFCTPTYDFGIFSQMFYYMKIKGLPFTTLERDGLLSHFAVHMSPIYYLFLPFYWLAPFPATLQILQALVITSAVIPLWKLGKLHGLSPFMRLLLCVLLLLYPAYSGGTSYDLHENCFLAPLLLWLFYGLDRQNTFLLLFCAFLTLMVKEDAAVYVAVIALWLVIRSLLNKSAVSKKQFNTGIFLLILSIGWFLLVTGYLQNSGDGVMTYRYDNFMYDNSSSLITVIKAGLLCPMKALYECVDPEKLSFLAMTMLPLMGLPFLTRKYERYILLIPFLLVNLMSDYQYQHDIFFQYTFGSTACLFYLVLLNLSDFPKRWLKTIFLTAGIIIGAFLFYKEVIPKAIKYPTYCREHRDFYKEQSRILSKIPNNASVAATTFYTTPLSSREILYDIQYCSTEHLLEAEYVVLSMTSTSAYRKYAVNGESGLENLIKLLEVNGYELFAELDGTMQILKK